MFPNPYAHGGCTCEVMKTYVAMEAEDRVIQFLLGLNKSFMSIRGQILSSGDLPNINRVFSIVQQDEKQKNFHKRKNTKAVAFSVETTPRRTLKVIGKDSKNYAESALKSTDWIIDTGASQHLSRNKLLFHNLRHHNLVAQFAFLMVKFIEFAW